VLDAHAMIRLRQALPTGSVSEQVVQIDLTENYK
jgi:hypothetical protein